MTTLSHRSTSVTFALVFAVALLMGKSYLVFGGGVIFALCALPCFVMLFWRHPLILLSLWPVTLALELLFLDFETGSVRLHSFYLFPLDLPIFFTVIHLVISAALRREDLFKGLKGNPFLSLFIFLVGVYIVAYTPIFGKSAIGEARKVFSYFLFPLLAMVSIKEPKDLRRFISVIFFVAVFILVAATLKIYLSKSVHKIVGSEACLMLTLAAFSTLLLNINGIFVANRIIDSVMLMLFLVMVVITGHRSVWLAGAFGFFLVLGLHRERVLSLPKAGMVLILIFGLVTMACIVKPEFGSSLKKGFWGIIDPYSDPTASWRIEGWKKQIGGIAGTKEVLLGEGIGGYYSWQHRGVEVKAAPHNAYVQLMLKIGFVGLSIYGLLMFKFFRETMLIRKKLPPGDMKACMEMGVVNVGAAHAYMVAYGFPLFMLVFFALAITAVKLQQDSRTVSNSV